MKKTLKVIPLSLTEPQLTRVPLSGFLCPEDIIELRILSQDRIRTFGDLGDYSIGGRTYGVLESLQGNAPRLRVIFGVVEHRIWLLSDGFMRQSISNMKYVYRIASAFFKHLLEDNSYPHDILGNRYISFKGSDGSCIRKTLLEHLGFTCVPNGVDGTFYGDLYNLVSKNKRYYRKEDANVFTDGINWNTDILAGAAGKRAERCDS